ncbi:MAG: hypothetical protein Q3966_09570 [Neisseria sp.]|nr:hypothetical protein [Neisseria sp.]
MKKTITLALAALTLAACANTWHGVKEDASNNVERTKDAVMDGGNAVGRGISNVGERIEEATTPAEE